MSQNSMFRKWVKHNSTPCDKFDLQCQAEPNQLGCRGSVIFSTGTGKTEIAFECAKLAAKRSGRDHFTILFLVPRIVLIEQNVTRLRRYGISDDHIGIYYGERKEVKEITISTYQS